MNRLSKIIEDVGFDELKLLQQDLKEGNIERLINNRIKHFEDGGVTICPVCHTGIPNPDDGAFTLFFGSKGLRRKATFCATDCLEYFLDKIKSINMKKIKD